MARTPIESAVKTWACLVKAQARVMKAIEADLKKEKLPPLAWYDVLLELKQAVGESLRPYELETRLLLAQHSVSRLIDRMEAKQLVQRQPCDEDGRGQVIAITEQGRTMQKTMWPIYRSSIKQHVGTKLTMCEAGTLAALLQRLLQPDM